MSNAVMYGLYVTAANIVLTLIMYFTGLWKSAPAVGYIAFVFLVLAIVWAIKDRRDNENGGEIRFGQAFSTGFTVVLITSILGAIFFFVYSEFINTEFETYMAEQMEAGMAQQRGNMSEAEFEQARQMSGMMSSPAMMAISQILMSLIIGSIVTAITAAIMKKEPRPQVM